MSFPYESIAYRKHITDERMRNNANVRSVKTVLDKVDQALADMWEIVRQYDMEDTTVKQLLAFQKRHKSLSLEIYRQVADEERNPRTPGSASLVEPAAKAMPTSKANKDRSEPY